jgi:hypothetical protein
MKKIIVNNKNLYVVNVPDDGYRETLVQNPNMTNRYGFLEVTSRATGLDFRKRIHDIEQHEIVGMYSHDDKDPLVKELHNNKCFIDTKKVVVLQVIK